MIRVSSCCCGCSLSTGAVIIAVVGLVLDVLASVGLLVVISSSRVQDDDAAKWMAVGLLVFALIHMIACGLLILGSLTKKRTALLPWGVLQVLFIVLVAIVGILTVRNMIIADEGKVGDVKKYRREAGISLGIMVKMFVLSAYQFLVVHSFYAQLEDAEKAVKAKRLALVKLLTPDDDSTTNLLPLDQW